MAVVDLADLVDQRLAQLAEDDEDIRAEEVFLSSDAGVWSVLSLYDGPADRLIGFEFIETAESLRRPDAVLQYNESAIGDLIVLVIVPDEAFLEMSEALARAGDPSIRISDYSAMELVPQVMAG